MPKCALTMAQETFDTRDIDWFVWEPVDSAHKVSDDDGIVPLTDEEFERIAIDGRGPVTIEVPLGRYSATVRRVVVVAPCTVRNLLTTIHAYYDAPAIVAHVHATGEEHDTRVAYARAVAAKIRDGVPAKVVELNGSTSYTTAVLGMRPGGAETMLAGVSRRHALMDCQGRVRFEGLYSGDDGQLAVALGT